MGVYQCSCLWRWGVGDGWGVLGAEGLHNVRRRTHTQSNRTHALNGTADDCKSRVPYWNDGTEVQFPQLKTSDLCEEFLKYQTIVRTCLKSPMCHAQQFQVHPVSIGCATQIELLGFDQFEHAHLARCHSRASGPCFPCFSTVNIYTWLVFYKERVFGIWYNSSMFAHHDIFFQKSCLSSMWHSLCATRRLAFFRLAGRSWNTEVLLLNTRFSFGSDSFAWKIDAGNCFLTNPHQSQWGKWKSQPADVTLQPLQPCSGPGMDPLQRQILEAGFDQDSQVPSVLDSNDNVDLS